MKIILGPTSFEMGVRISIELSTEVHPVDHRFFPDGESYIRFTAEIKNEEVVIVQTTFPEPDRSLQQLYLMIDTARELGAKKVMCIVPYLAYARQDKRFLDGEILSLGTIMKLLEATGANELIVIDVHNEESLKGLRADGGLSIQNLTAMPLLAEYLKIKGFENAYSLAPDVGAKHLVEGTAKVLRGDFGFFVKKRDRKTGEIMMELKDLEVEGKKAIVFDDIISSGGTTAKAVSGLRKLGASKVAAACTHGLFMRNAVEKIREAGADYIVSTDTIQTPHSQVSVASLIAEYLKKL